MTGCVAHLHFDPIGGIAGDMFAAALLDAFPALEQPLLGVLAPMAGSCVSAEVIRGPVDGFAGARFVVKSLDGAPPRTHRNWADIRVTLSQSELTAAVRDHAIGIFETLATAEAAVHGIPIDEVHFHEVGAWDSIIDVVAAAFLLDALSPMGWSIGALPLGGGTVTTEHGVMPVPAPAAAHLMRGFDIVDDAISGERVTPTGAAIVAYFRATIPGATLNGRLTTTGMGFGSRTLPGRPNALRVLAVVDNARGSNRDEVKVIRFEIDDQTGEDLAVAVEALRRCEGVLDILQTPAYGKKGRLVVSVQLLAHRTHLDDIVRSVFLQTTTLGVRVSTEQRTLLHRFETDVGNIPVKLAKRGSERTAKASMDVIAGMAEAAGGGHREREALRGVAERHALQRDDES